MITPQEAKELALEIWRYFRDHPDIESKGYLPGDLIDKIGNMICGCPLCELFFRKSTSYMSESECLRKGCPLGHCGSGSAYSRWGYGNEIDNFQAATEIVKLVEAWEPENMQGGIRC